MIWIKEKAFLLRLVPYKERDLILEFFGHETGRFSCVLYRARTGKNLFLYQPGDQLELEYQKREHQELMRLDSSVALKVNRAGKLSYEQFIYLSFFLELVLKTTEAQVGSREVYQTLEDFTELGIQQQNPKAGLLFSLLKLTESLGFMLDFHCCSGCSKPTYLAGDPPKFRRDQYQLNDPGLLCSACSTQTTLTGSAIKALYLACRPEFVKAPAPIDTRTYSGALLALSNRLIRLCEINCRSFLGLQRLLLVELM